MTPTNFPDSPPIPDDLPNVPIVLGVTGHMDLRPEDADALRAAATWIFDDFRARYPHTSLVLLSSLARGSDQLLATVALAMKITVRAPLPFPAPVYAAGSTFTGDPAAGQTVLDWVNGGVVESFVVPMPGGPASGDLPGWQQFIADETSRRSAYANAGGYIVRHCHALIALWDGKCSGKPSGTEEIVRCKLEGEPPTLYPHRKPLLLGAENGPVYVIHTPRKGKVSAPGDPGPGQMRVCPPGVAIPPMSDLERDWRVSHRHRFLSRVTESFGSRNDLSPGRAEWRQFHETCQSIDDFNRDLERHRVKVRRDLTRALPRQKAWQQSGGIGPAGAMPRLLLLREAAASLARLTNPAFDAWQVFLFVLLFLSILCFHLYAHVEGAEHAHLPWLLGSFVLLLLGCALIVGWVWLRRISERRLDYRALAEILRVRVFWGAAGIGESVADSYFGQMRSEMSWARRALQGAAPSPEAWQESFQALAPPDQLARLRWVCAEWIGKQTGYFEGKRHGDHRKARLLRRWGFITAVIGWTIAATLLVVGMFKPHSVIEPAEDWLIASGAFVLLGGLLVAYCERCAYEETAKQFERMHTVFKQGQKEITRDLEKGAVLPVQEAMQILGREAITENVQWLILRRNRPFELLIH